MIGKRKPCGLFVIAGAALLLVGGLAVAADAQVIDTTGLGIDQVVEEILRKSKPGKERS